MREPLKDSSNQDIMELLMLKLSVKDLMSARIPRFVKDVMLGVHDSGHKSPNILNQMSRDMEPLSGRSVTS
jgi:hypothetical protein